jgi:RNA polymerase sigma factor (sigma-70 family)
VTAPSNLEPLTDAQRETVLANTGLVGFVVSRFAGMYVTGGYTNDDALQDGYVGLCRAVRAFDPDRGVALSTFAAECIRTAIARGRDAFGGVSYRRRHVGRPVSLDALVGTGFDPADPFTFAEQMADVLSVDFLARLKPSCCRDALDRDVFDRRIAAPKPEPQQAVADRWGTTRQTVANREARMVAELGQLIARDRRDLEAAR